MKSVPTSPILPVTKRPAVQPICWDDWFYFDAEQQKCLFRPASDAAQGEYASPPPSTEAKA